MADEGSVDRGIKESSTAPDAKPKNPSTEKTKRGGIFSRLWNGLFRMHGDDYEKRLQHISKEEAAVIVRLKRRSQVWRSRATHFLIFSIILEVIAVGYAIIMTRSVDLNWKIRAYRVSPMFLWPFISFVVYSAVKYFLRMRNRKDQKTLERLRAERQAKIDELKEKTNYYITQQLIQRYDTDPAAKAAAATVLASKLGADSGLKVYLGDELKSNAPRGMSNDVELMESSGLRNRKQMHARSSSAGSSVLRQSNEEMTTSEGAAGLRSREQSQPVIDEHDHVQESSIHDRGWLARIVALLMADDPKQSYALICSNCHMHNGLVKEEEFPYVTYYCPHCHSLNRSRPMEEHVSGSSNVASSPINSNNGISNGSGSVSDAAADIVSEEVASGNSVG